MKCFYHSEVDAVGVCKTCSKGICHNCLTDVGNGIACTGTCVEEVKMVNALIENNRRYGTFALKRSRIIVSLMLLAFGGLFIYTGLKYDNRIPFINWFGWLFLVFGLLYLVMGLTSKRKNDTGK